MDKREIVYNFVKEIYDSLFNNNKNAKFNSRDLGPGNSLAHFVDLTEKNYIEQYYTTVEDTEDLLFEATYQTGKVLFYPDNKINKLYRIYNLAKKNRKFPLLGKILGDVVNPILRKVNAIRIYIYEHTPE